MLAIAGLVLAIVFIAVPALQRNSRNTQRSSDIAVLKAQFATHVANNNGRVNAANLATTIKSNPAELNRIGLNAAGAWTADPAVSTAGVTVSANTIVVETALAGTAAPVAVAATSGEDWLTIVVNHSCANNKPALNTAGTATTADDDAIFLPDRNRGAAFLYRLEGEATLSCDNA